MNETPVAQELVIVRTFDAPRSLVFAAFAEPERLGRWWGPKGFEMGVHRLDFRPGGVFHYSMKSPDGAQMWGKFVYREIIEPQKIVYLSSFSDAAGGLTRHPMWPEWPLEILNSVTLEEHQGKTTLTLRGYPINAPQNEMRFFLEAQKGVRLGFQGTLDQLERFLDEAGREILVSRVLDAPPEQVFKAFADAAYIGKWWGPDGCKTATHQMDFRVGGVWRYTLHAPDGTDYPNQVTYLEIARPERIVYDHGDFDTVHFRSTITLEAQGSKTKLTLRLLFPTREARDENLKFGASEGGQQTLGRLEQYLLGREEIRNKTITVFAIVEAPIQTAWDAYTQPEHIVRWNFASDDWHCPGAENDLRVGGTFRSRMAAKDGSVGFDFGGYYSAVEPLKQINYTLGEMQGGEAGRKAQVEFEALGAHQTKVTVTFDMENQHSEEMQRSGWQAILENYKKHAESLAVQR